MIAATSFLFSFAYDKNTKILDISNKKIEGILCLNDFEKLEELNCSFNEITEIINLPYSLKYLNCSNNKIVNLYKLPNDMIGLNCKKNLLNELYYPFNIKPNKYPSKLTHLTLGEEFNQPIDNLPNNIEILKLGKNFNQSIDKLPTSITYLNYCNTAYYKQKNQKNIVEEINAKGMSENLENNIRERLRL